MQRLRRLTFFLFCGGWRRVRGLAQPNANARVDAVPQGKPVAKQAVRVARFVTAFHGAYQGARLGAMSVFLALAAASL